MRKLVLAIAPVAVLVCVAPADGQTSRLRANRAAARRDASALLAWLRLPPSVTRVKARPPTTSTVSVTDSGRWTTDESKQAVIDYVKAHPPLGAKLQSWGSGGNVKTGAGDLSLMYVW